MRRRFTVAVFGGVLALLLVAVTNVHAHFGVIIPSDDIVTQKDSKKLTLEAKFIHPMENVFMDMEKPKRVSVVVGADTQDITNTVVEKQISCEGKRCRFWQIPFTVKKPGDHLFLVEPQPYWEPAEDKFIVHYTKVVVNALGKEEGWDKPVHAPIEIVPLTRPYGLWTGNVFQGQVLVAGKPAPGVDVEVEYLSASPENKKKVTIPADSYVTQVVKTDVNGVFTYAMPKAGWWGFAALTEGPEKLTHDGQEKEVEIGGVLWVHVIDMK